MKKLLPFIIALFVSTNLLSQIPQSFKYQAVLRDARGNIKANTATNIVIGIIPGSATGTAVYSETHNTTTDGYGLINLEIGKGTVTVGSFSGIDWGTNTYFVKVTVDGVVMGASQLLSVPYALYAKASGGYTESDPVFAAWNKTAGISIPASQVSDFQSSVTNIAAVLLNTAKNGYPAADANKLATITGTNTGDQDLSGKVDKVAGKGLSTNDFTTAEQTKLAAITGTITGNQDLSSKVDKVTGKGLSTNDYTDADAMKLAAITGTNTVDQDLSGLATTSAVTTSLNLKVDKEAGKGLSTNDYTTAEKTKLAAITGTNTGDQDLNGLATTSAVTTALATKVDKEVGKGLSTNDFTTVEKTKLTAITGTNTGDQDLSGLATTTSVTTGLGTKVDKEAGKGLSTNDYTTTEQTKLAAITGTNTGDQDLSGLATTASVTTSLNLKVDKVAGKGLSTNDYTTAEQTKVSNLSGTNTGDQNLTGLNHTNRAALDAVSGVNTGDNATNTQYSGLVSNATHTGEVTGSDVLTINNAAVLGKTLTGFTSGAGVISASDNILQAIQKLNGNDSGGANATHTGDATGAGILTLATVNSNVGTFNNVTINAKGLTTAGSNVSYLTSETDPTVKAINGIVKSNGTTISAATAGTDYLTPSGSAALLTSFPTLNQNTTGTAANVTGTVALANGGTGSATQNFVDLTTDQTVAGAKTLSGNTSVGGTLAVTGVATLTAAPVLSSATASQALFTDALKNVVSNTITGTGSVVMSISPTLTGVPVAPTATAGTSTTQIATTAFVAGSVSSGAPDATASATGKVQLAGDLGGTSSSAAAPVISNDAITTAKILNSNVTYAKIQNVSATDKVLGRTTTGAGVVEEISTTGSGNVVRATSPTLVTPALGTPSALVGTNITGTAAGLTAGTVTTNANFTGDVTSSGNATTLTDKAVTLAKMNDMATASLIYRKSASTGVPEVQTLATIKTDLGLTGINSGDQTLSSLGAIASNTAITAGTNTKITYDAKGLVTAGAAATTADIAASTDRNYVTDAQQAVITNTSGTNTGDQSNITGSAASFTGSLAGDVSGTQGATVIGTGAVTSAKILDGTIANVDIATNAAIADTKLATIATAGKVSNSATTATAANTANTIVLRDGSGNFAAGRITVATPLSDNDAATKAYVDILLDKIRQLQIDLGVRDVDNNAYDAVKIGDQVWMVENLKTTKYNDGTAIPNVIDNTAWGELLTEAYCWYNNDAATYKATYGALYNWYAVATGKLCPTGWHVPSDAEWTTLTTYLGGVSVAGGKLKETGTTHWTTPNIGATNEISFTALPGGFRISGTFNYVGIGGRWWSSTNSNETYAWDRMISHDYSEMASGTDPKKDGYSVRCLYD